MRVRLAVRPFVTQSVIVGMLCVAQFATNMWTTQVVRPLKLDQFLLYIAVFGGVNLTVVLLGDRLARARGWWRRSAYMAIGAAGSSVAHYVALAPAAYVETAYNGVLALLLAIPALLGATTGFLLHSSLGYAADGDDPQALAAAAGDSAAPSPGGLLSAGETDYYGGPLQVRTSTMAAWIAALIGAALFSLVTMFSLNDGILPADVLPPLIRTNPALAALMAIGVYSIPFLFFIRKSHDFLQARGKDGIKSYALAGVFVPLGFCTMLLALMGPFAVMIVLPWFLPSVVAMTAYHRLAGFEPLSLPGDIEVSDRRTLLPADHVRRRMRRVIATDRAA
jgi:hypothetical protein